MIILGVSGFENSVPFKKAQWPGLEEREYRISQGHDSAAALVVDGTIVAAAAEERFTRKKHTGDFPERAIQFCLSSAGIDYREVDEIAHSFDYSPYRFMYLMDPVTAEQFAQVFSREALLKQLKRALPDYPPDRFRQVPHHLAHAASAYYTSGWQECLVVVIDGMGEAQSATVYRACENALIELDKISANDSIGILYSLVTLHLGFDFNSDEYKIMGLAPYGDPERFRAFFREHVQRLDGGTIRIPCLRRNQARADRENYGATRRYLHEHLVPCRRPDSEIRDIHCDVAAALQECLDEVMLHLCGHAARSTGLRRLALAGGVALNCTANGRLLASGMFEEIYVQPAAADDGSALGAALWRASRTGPVRNVRMPVPFLGPAASRQEIDQAIENFQDRIEAVHFASLRETCAAAAQLIHDGRVVAWYRGRMEFGPRALGNRSILADPSLPDIRDRINAMVKMREAFRPFAPAVSLEQVHEWFKVQSGTRLPYMIMTVDVRDEHRASLPGITHVNGSARVQTVSKEDNGDFHTLLEEIGKRTGRELVLNTSFNVKGQPIVNTPHEAIETFLRTGIDSLFLENTLVQRVAVPREERLRENSNVGDAVLCETFPTSNQEHQTIIQLFDDQAARTPLALALTASGRELTYGQLQERVNRLACDLQEMGVGPEVLVGVFMDRSVETILGILAILKAGGAYVPLDPAYPVERLSFIIDDSRLSLILTTSRVAPRLPAVAARVVVVDGATPATLDRGSNSVRCAATGQSLAYVIYTSGSTGRPKGVMVEHRNVLSFFAAMDRVLGPAAGVWLSVTSVSFDISVLELLWTLTRGFHVVLHGDEGVHTIAGEIVRHGVTHLQSTPSLARMLAADGATLAALGSLKRLLLGGEALPAALVNVLRSTVSGEIYNMYGPTETTIWSTVYRVPEVEDPSAIVSIGRPLANTRAYLLDPGLEPVAVGEAGELFLGGEGVARGYWDRPEVTEERFVPDRFAGEGRMYRTGDLARMRADGNLEFLGRADFQVKLGGHRIELGEIEAVLEQHISVKQAVVVAREDRPGDKRLVAYVVPGDGSAWNPAALRAALESKLPVFMVPAHFVPLDRLPLTPNGKIDRQALPAVLTQKLAAEIAPAPAEDAQRRCERIVGRCWAEALGVDEVGPDVNIFDLGVTSLMVPDVQIELQRLLKREIPLVDLFEFHTVRRLAAHLAGDSAPKRTVGRAQRRLAARRQGEPR